MEAPALAGGAAARRAPPGFHQDSGAADDRLAILGELFQEVARRARVSGDDLLDRVIVHARRLLQQAREDVLGAEQARERVSAHRESRLGSSRRSRGKTGFSQSSSGKYGAECEQGF